MSPFYIFVLVICLAISAATAGLFVYAIAWVAMVWSEKAAAAILILGLVAIAETMGWAGYEER